MKRINTTDLIPGMVTAEDVYTFNGQLVLPKGLTLTDKTITKLEFYSIINIRIDDASIEEAKEDLEPVIANEANTYSEQIKQSPQFKEFKERFEKEVVKFQGILDSVAKHGQPVDIDAVMVCVDNLLAVDQDYLSIFDMLHNLRQYDDLTYVHSMNVALICNVFARWLNMSEDEIRTATVCGLLHDLGKVLIPDSVIKKPGKLTNDEYTTVKKHTLEGYNVLRKSQVPEYVSNSALMHHERCDGTGYPFGIKNSKIEPYAKMVAIADVYDAMTSARVYRGPMCPFEVIEIFENEGLQKYDTRYILTFLENIVNTYIGQTVRLNNGIEGEVVFINRSHLAKPTIKTADEFIALSAHPEMYIKEII